MKSFAVAESPILIGSKRSDAAQRAPRSGLLQAKLLVGGSSDSYEQEADNVADAIVHDRPEPSGRVAQTISPLAQRVAEAPAKKDDEKHLQKKGKDISDDDSRKRKDEQVAQKKAAGSGTESSLETLGAPSRVESEIGAMRTGGNSLAASERRFFQDRLGYDLGEVRIHAGANAARAASALNARAFTVGRHVFFGSGEYRPQTTEGRHLIAHELTHTIQQTAPSARAARKVQRGLFDRGKEWVLGKVRDFAAGMPGYRLLTVLLAQDPITDEPVKQTAEELVHGVLDFVPSGEDIFNHLQSSGQIRRFADYFNQQVAQLNLTWDTVKGLFNKAWNSLDFTDIASPSAAWEKIKAIFEPPVIRLKNFAVNVGAYILDAIKKKVLDWLKDWATKIPGYSLLTFILGKDPFTDEPVERTATNFVKAVLDLAPGGDKMFENLQKSKTIEKTVDWLDLEIKKLDLSWEKINALFRQAWDVISIADLLHPLEFAGKIRAIFEAPAIRVVNFAIAVGKKVLEFIFEGAMLLAGPIGQRIIGILRKASAAFSLIVSDPVAFLGHLLDAVSLGFKQFVAKIGEYLQEGVIAWLTGALADAGIVLPKVWDLKGILSLVLQILGITYQKMRAKVVKALGDKGEKIVSTAEKVWSFLVALVTEGPAAAWNKITEAIGNFWDMVIGGIKNWAIVKIIKVAVTELLTLFNPVGAIIEAIIEIYRTVEFFVKKINQILSLVEAIVDSIANIAAGKIAAAANYVEKTLARTIPVIIGFLASLVGLGDVSDGIRDTIEALQAKVDEGIDKAIEWIVEQIKRLFGGKEEGEHDEKWDAAVAGVQGELAKLEDSDKLDDEDLKAQVPVWQATYGFSELTVESTSEGRTISGAMSAKKPVTVLGHLGTKDDPFPLLYPKPKSVYPTLYFGEETAAVRTQKYLKAAYDDPETRKQMNIKRYVPFPSGDQELTNGNEIGIKGDFNLKTGDLVGPLKQEGTPGGSKINNRLKPYGFRSETEDLQGDHFWEIQYGGVDTIENLWPLDSGINNASGNYLKNLEVKMPSGKEKKVTELKTNAREYWFTIKGFKQP